TTGLPRLVFVPREVLFNFTNLGRYELSESACRGLCGASRRQDDVDIGRTHLPVWQDSDEHTGLQLRLNAAFASRIDSQAGDRGRRCCFGGVNDEAALNA